MDEATRSHSRGPAAPHSPPTTRTILRRAHLSRIHIRMLNTFWSSSLFLATGDIAAPRRRCRDQANLARVSGVAAIGTESDGLRHLLEVADRRRQREDIEKDMRARLDLLDMPVVELPMLFTGPLGPKEVDAFATLITGARGGHP